MVSNNFFKCITVKILPVIFLTHVYIVAAVQLSGHWPLCGWVYVCVVGSGHYADITLQAHSS